MPWRRSVCGCCLLVFIIGVHSKISAQRVSSAPQQQTIRTVNADGDARTRLQLVITTRSARGAGTDNSVYFDVGPWSWRVNKSWRNDFESSHTDTFDLKVPDGFAVNDILWLRLHKKGLLGVTGTRDGLTGAWHPERVTLLVNGVEHSAAEVTSPLNSRYWFWRKLGDVDPYADPNSFLRSLRKKPNDSLPWLARVTGFFTTPLFKKKGISGWIKCPEQKEKDSVDKDCSRVPALVCATGKVFQSPARSNDGLATIDLALDSLEFCSDTHDCYKRGDLDQAEVAVRPRYLRIEYRHRRNRIPYKNERVRMCGQLLWDTDREGWWEIHPRGASDVEFLPR